MELVELHHMLVYSLHGEQFLIDPESSTEFAKGSCNAILRDKTIELYNRRPKDDIVLGKTKKCYHDMVA